MNETERLHTLEKIQHYEDEVRKLEEEERLLLEKHGLDSKSAYALLEGNVTEEVRAKVTAGVQERLQLIERDFEFRRAAKSNATPARNSARRHQSKI